MPYRKRDIKFLVKLDDARVDGQHIENPGAFPYELRET